MSTYNDLSNFYYSTNLNLKQEAIVSNKVVMCNEFVM